MAIDVAANHSYRIFPFIPAGTVDSLSSLCTFAKKIVPAPLDVNEQLLNIRQSMAGLVPEIFLAAFFCLFLMAELFIARRFNNERQGTWLLNLGFLGCFIALVLVMRQWNARPSFQFESLLFLDRQAVFFKVIVLMAWAFTLVHIRILRYQFPPEFYALLIAAVLGLNLLSMSTHMLSIYLSLELVSISSYLLVSISPDRKAAEGGIKYLLFGAASSAVMLYGISLIYGLTGTLSIADENLTAGLLSNSGVVITVSIVLVLAGIFFKLSLVPFHLWTPDVYEAAPTPLVSFLSVAPKAAAILVLLRMAPVLPHQYLPIIGGIALISITYGNIAALWQSNARRLLAYSSIAQAGYLLIGIAAYSQFGFESAVFYTGTYVVVNMAAFFLIDFLRPAGSTRMADFEGLGRKYIWISVLLTIVMVALAGLPPTGGFTSKMLVFSSLWDSYHQQEASWMLWLLIGGILNAAIALVYYIKIPYLLFFKELNPVTAVADSGFPGKIFGGFLLLIVLALFFNPALLMNWISSFGLDH
jgi:NADH-quinone oxidoreductase subunit N